MGLGQYVSVAMDFQLKDSDGVVDKYARNEFQKVATTGHDKCGSSYYQIMISTTYLFYIKLNGWMDSSTIHSLIFM